MGGWPSLGFGGLVWSAAGGGVAIALAAWGRARSGFTLEVCLLRAGLPGLRPRPFLKRAHGLLLVLPQRKLAGGKSARLPAPADLHDRDLGFCA